MEAVLLYQPLPHRPPVQRWAVVGLRQVDQQHIESNDARCSANRDSLVVNVTIKLWRARCLAITPARASLTEALVFHHHCSSARV